MRFLKEEVGAFTADFAKLIVKDRERATMFVRVTVTVDVNVFDDNLLSLLCI